MAELSVQIGANIKELIQKLNLTEKELIKLEKLSKKSASGFANEFKKAAGGTDKFKKSTVNATPALQEFSRVIQDAPFGIMGVGNNIQQLTANFGHLSKSAGGSKAALKEMVGSLKGPGGVLLAVSVVTTLLTLFGDKLFKTKNKSEELRKKQEELTDSLDDYVLGLGAVEKAQLKGEQSAVKELTTLRLLKAQIEDTALSNEKRTEAVDNLRELYPDYLKGMTDEKILGGDLKDVYDELTTSLLNKAKAQAAASLITENAKKELILSQQLEDSKENLQNKELERAKVLGKVNTQNKRGAGALSGLNSEISKEKEEQLRIEKEILKIQEDNLKLAESVKDFGGISKKTKGGSGEDVKDIKTFAERKKKLFDSINNDLLKDEEETIDDFIKHWEKVEIKFDPFDGDYSKINDEFQKIIDAEKRLQTQTQIMGNVVGSTFSALSNQIASELETGNAVVDAFTQSLIASLTQVAIAGLQSLITEKLIGVGKNQINRSVSSANAITVATSAAAAAGPAGIFAMPGLIASQLALVNGAFAGISSFAKGGFSGDDNLAFLNKNELVLRPFEQAALYNVLKGTGISGVNNNVGSNTTNNIVGEVVLRGQNQVIQLRRAEKRMRRNFNS